MNHTALERNSIRHQRRGNTIVLVTGVLVLLVIIATAYVSRTQAGRQTAVTYPRTHQRDDVQRLTADQFAEEIALALFVRPINTCIPLLPEEAGNTIASANRMRHQPFADAVRFGIDRVNGPCTGDFYYNHAPYELIAWTNPPDPASLNAIGLNLAMWPQGAGNPTGGAGTNPIEQARLAAESNPLGNPGFGDCRWLRDFEPMRFDLWNAFSNSSGQDGVMETFTHWRHMSYPVRPENGLRLVYNIANIEASLVTDLNIPVEQWTSAPPHLSRYNIAGDAMYPGFIAFRDQWVNWFDSLTSYQSIYLNPFAVPHNFYHLKNLFDSNVNNPVHHEPGERPEDEFVGAGMTDAYGNFWPDGTPRWNVSRVLCDTDGDGFTDSFWFLAPTPIANGIRTIVAVSIIDNSAMLNVNVAGRYLRNDIENASPTTVQRTRGWGPFDLAILGQGMGANQLTSFGYGNWNTGILDNPERWFLPMPNLQQPPNASASTRYDAPTSWPRYMASLGLHNITNGQPDLWTRMDYWLNAGSRGIYPNVLSRYMPFSLGDEIELRMFAGNNFPWAVTRFERATENTVTTDHLLRTNLNREESSEFLRQLSNRELVQDVRRHLTVFSGARNDIAPPWLWAFQPNQDIDDTGPLAPGDLNGDGVIDQLDYGLLRWGMRKFDLRASLATDVLGPFGVANAAYPNGLPEIHAIDLGTNILEYNSKFGIALRDVLERCLIDSDVNLPPGNFPGSYYGSTGAAADRTRAMAAAYAANIVQWRDRDTVNPYNTATTTNQDFSYSPLEESVPVKGSSTTRYMGIEAQPFLVEAYIGHVYKAAVVPPADTDGNPYTNAGHYVVLDPPTGGGQSERHTVVVVQIANPFSVPVDLSQYRLNVFGQTFELANAFEVDEATNNPTPARTILAPATDDKPTTAIYYSIHTDLIGTDPTDNKWRNFLDINPADHPDTTIIARVMTDSTNLNSFSWRNTRDWYDSWDRVNGTIVLSRRDPNPAMANPWIDIDRIDRVPGARFRESVNRMGRPDTEPVPMNDAIEAPAPPGGGPYPLGIDIGPQGLAYNHFVQWSRITRSWGVDIDRNGRYDPNERNPRYVFGHSVIVEPAGASVTNPALDGITFLERADANGKQIKGNRYKFTRNPDADLLSQPVPNLPWFARSYRRADNVIVPEQADPANPALPFPRKPTFFDMNRARDPVAACGSALPNTDPYFPLGFSYPDKGWYSQLRDQDPVAESVDDATLDLTNPAQPVSRVRLRFPMQMLQKNGDFEQIGELLNIWLYGHEITGTATSYTGTEKTFSEQLMEPAAVVGPLNARLNRLQLGQVIGKPVATNVSDPRHAVPNLPAGARVFDAFVCDGLGVDPVTDLNNDGVINATDTNLRNLMIFSNAKNFDGSATPGLVNINTTSVAAKAIPNWSRLVHGTGRHDFAPPGFSCPGTPPLGNEQVLTNYSAQNFVANFNDTNASLPRSMVAEALVQYRERANGQLNNGVNVNPTGAPLGPDYQDRGTDIRAERGYATIGELLQLNIEGQAPPASVNEPGFVNRPTAGAASDDVYNQYWRIDLGITPAYIPLNQPDELRAKPVWGVYTGAAAPSAPLSPDFQASLRLSTDVNDEFDPFRSDFFTTPNNPLVVKRPDSVAGDVEEANSLFSAASNMITTRSDTFTVYFRIRNFRQNTSIDPPVWDATNPDYIVDDSRYVMLVDRSSVNKPGDKPRILYLEKLPN